MKMFVMNIFVDPRLYTQAYEHKILIYSTAIH